MYYTCKVFVYVLLFSGLLIWQSCDDQLFVRGYSSLISVTDTTLNDSSMFVGQVRQLDLSYSCPCASSTAPFTVWIDSTQYKTDVTIGTKYTLRLLPGTYTVKCQNKNNNSNQLIEVQKDITIEKNQKIRIDFYLGYPAE